LNKIKIGTKEYNLKLSINGLIELEESGVNITDIEASGSSGLKTMRSVFHNLLVGGGNDVSESDAGNIMSDYIAENGLDSLGGLVNGILGGGKQTKKAQLVKK